MRRFCFIVSLLLSLTALAQQERRIPVLRAQFQDCTFSISEEAFLDMLQRAGCYFTEQHAGKVQFIFDPGPVITLGSDVARYGHNSTSSKDELLYKAVQETCFASESAIDFKSYDSDNDNIVDNVCILFAGASESGADNPDLIWSQQNRLSALDAPIYIGGKRIDSFSVSAEADSLGTFCHEYAHALGLPDFYDTDGEGSGGLSEAFWGRLSLMDAGNLNRNGTLPPNFNAVELDLLGLGQCEDLSLGSWTLQPLSREQRYIKAETDNDREYFLFECRDNSGWDEGIEGNGLLIYHIDRSDSNTGYSDYYRIPLTASQRWQRSEINCRPDHQCADLCEADSGTGDISMVFFPCRTHTSFGSDTHPAFRSWNGKGSNLTIAGIVRNPDGSVSFTVVEPVIIQEVVSYQDAAIIKWETDEAIGRTSRAEISWVSETGQADTLKVGSGTVCCTLEHLKPGTTYKAEVKVFDANGEAYSVSTSFKTKIWREELQPYIYLGSAERSENGHIVRGSRIPLRVYNVPDAEEVIWTLDGRRIGTGPDGYYTIDKGGILKAQVLHTDGSTDILIKKLELE